MQRNCTTRAETACCIWEALLELNMSKATDTFRLPAKVHADFGTYGTAAMRSTAVAWADLCEDVYAMFGGCGGDWDAYTFDWDFVPAFVAALYEVGAFKNDIYRYMRKDLQEREQRNAKSGN